MSKTEEEHSSTCPFLFIYESHIESDLSRPPELEQQSYDKETRSFSKMSKIHPQYIPRDPAETQSISSSVQVIRTSDNAQFLAAKLPDIRTKDAFNTDMEGNLKITTKLANAILPVAALPISRILNHQNIVSMIDIVHKSALEGNNKELGLYSDITIWEDMDAGSLAYLLPPVDKLPFNTDEEQWHNLTKQDFNRFSLPESLCWHVLKSISHALLWLHYGVKETPGTLGEYEKADDDWQPILIMDVSPSQIWFKRPRQGETYGECKLGGFQWAKVTGSIGGLVAKAHHRDNPPRTKRHYFPPVQYFTNVSFIK